MYHYFIINPIAGRLNADEVIRILEEICKDVAYSYDFSKQVLHAENLAYEACSKHKDIRVYSVGGDGTLNEVANGVLKSGNRDAILIPVPLGSGNDFVRSIGYIKKDSILNLLKKALTCDFDEFDVCLANNRYFLNISSLGFDAQVVANALKYKKNKLIPKGLAYYLSVFTTFISMKSYKVIVTMDDKEPEHRRITLVALANGKYYGGGIIPVPQADLKDGILDCCLVDKVNRIKVPIFFPKYAKGEHGSLKEVHFYKCKRFHLKCEEGEIAFNVDGELSYTNEVTFEICDNKIKVGLI